MCIVNDLATLSLSQDVFPLLFLWLLPHLLFDLDEKAMMEQAGYGLLHREWIVVYVS